VSQAGGAPSEALRAALEVLALGAAEQAPEWAPPGAVQVAHLAMCRGDKLGNQSARHSNTCCSIRSTLGQDPQNTRAAQS